MDMEASEENVNPPPWKGGDLLYNRRLKTTAYYKGSGGWCNGWVVVLPMDADSSTHEQTWNVEDVELVGRKGLKVVK